MKLYDPVLEHRVLISITDSPPSISSHILSEIDQSWFGFEPAIEVFNHVQLALKKTGDIPSARILSMGSTLTDRAKKFINRGAQNKASHPNRMRKMRDAKEAINILKEYRKQRFADEIGNAIADELVKDSPNHDGLFSAIGDRLLLAQRGSKNDIVHIGTGDNFDSDFDDMLSDDSADIIESGWPSFDKICLGFTRGDLVFLSSNYGGGKTAKVLNMAVNMYKKGRNVVIVELEMTRKKCWQRIWACETGIPYTSFRRHMFTDKERALLTKSREAWKNIGERNENRLSVWATADVTAGQIISSLKPFGYDVIIIDYVNLVQPDDHRKDERIQLSVIARAFKQAAKALNCVIVVLAQLNDDNKIKYAKAMAEHADFVLWWRVGEEEKISGMYNMAFDKGRDVDPTKKIRFKMEYNIMRVHDIGIVGDGDEYMPKKDAKKDHDEVKKKRSGMTELMTL